METTRKHFETIAATFAEMNKNPENCAKTLYEAAYRISRELADINPRFNRDKFMKACGF